MGNYFVLLIYIQYMYMLSSNYSPKKNVMKLRTNSISCERREHNHTTLLFILHIYTACVEINSIRIYLIKCIICTHLCRCTSSPICKGVVLQFVQHNVSVFRSVAKDLLLWYLSSYSFLIHQSSYMIPQSYNIS